MKRESHHRVNYEDPSQKFSAWVQRLGIERTSAGRAWVWFNETVKAPKLIAVTVFSVLISNLVNWDFETDWNYRVGETLESTIYSPLNFEMIDKLGTEERKRQSEAEIPIIFDYDPHVFERVSDGIYSSFRTMRSILRATPLLTSGLKREESIKDFFSHKAQFEELLGVRIPDFAFEWLVTREFNVRVENILIRQLAEWYQQRLVDSPDRSIPEGVEEVLARTISKNNRGKEFAVRRDTLLDVQNLELFHLGPSKIVMRFSPEDQDVLQNLVRFLLFPNLTLNKQEVSSRQQAARDGVSPIRISFRRGEEILGGGKVVQPFHDSIFREIHRLQNDPMKNFEIAAMAALLIACFYLFQGYLKRTSVQLSRKDLWVLGIILVFVVIIAKLFLFITYAILTTKLVGWAPTNSALYLTPVAAGPMLMGLLIPSIPVAWVFTFILSLMMGVMSDLNFTFMVASFLGGIVAAHGVQNCKKRSDIYRAGSKSGLITAGAIGLIMIIGGLDQRDLHRDLLFGIPFGFLSGVFSSLIAMMIVPLFESLFSYTTDVKLLELSNLNHPLLKEMIVNAPGTYHHSMMVGSMVEAAAEDIGANPLLAKVMCYYHDIGKINHAGYFIENQKQGHNPHDHISPFMSKTILIAHVKDGVEIGMKHKLGKPIIDAILQHHGTTLISYFYNKAQDLRGEDDNEVSEEDFRYPGPKPQFPEAALVMLADSIEAASRSLDEPTPIRLQNIVRNIIQRKFMDGQLDECSLTLRDLQKVEQSFIKILLGIYHQRIDYPRSAGGGAAESPTPATRKI